MADSNWAVKVGTRVTDDIQQQLNKMPVKSIVVTPILKGNQEFQRTATQFVDGTGQMVQVTKDLNKATGAVSESITKVKQSTQAVKEEIKDTSKHTATLGEKFVDVTKKVVAFGAVTSIIGLFTKAMSEAVQIVTDYNVATTEFSKVSNLSSEALDEYTQKLGEMGTEFARTRQEMVEASTEFVKSGFNEEQSAQLATTAVLFQNIADSELSAGEASAYLISQMKAFNITAEEATTIIDQTNEVSNRFAVSSTDISTALTKSSSALATYGNTMSESISLVTAGTEVMTGQASKVSKGLRSIGANIVKLADDSGKLEYSVNGMTKAISLFDEQGKALSTFDVLSKVAEDWDKMTQAEQSSLALAQAGKTQIDVYTSVLRNFGTALEANEVAINSNGSALKENEKYMQSISAKANLLKASISELVLGEGGLETLIKSLLDVSNSLVKFANSDMGRAIITVGAFTGAVNILNASFGMLAKSSIGIAVKELYALSTGMQVATKSTFATTVATQGLTKALLSSPLLIGGVLVGAVMAVSYALNDVYESTDELNDKVEELSKSTQSLQSEFDQLSTKADLTKSEEIRLGLLEAQIEANKILIQQEYDKASASRQYEESSGATFKNGQKVAKIDYSEYDNAIGINTEDTTVNQQIEAYKSLNRVKAESIEQDEAIVNKKAELKESLIQEALYFTQLIEDGVRLSEADERRYQAILEITGVVDSNNSSKKESLELSEEEIAQLEAISEALAKNLEQYSLTNVSLTDISDAYQTVIDSAKEYNENGYITLETYEKLMSLGAEYYNLLFDENGQLQLNAEALNNVTKAKIDEMAISQARAMLETADAYYAENGTLEGLTDTLRETTLATWDDVEATLASYEANGEDTGAIRKRINTLKLWADEAKRGVGITKTTTEETKSGTKAIDEQKEALDKLKDEYKAVTEYIKDQLESEISRIEDAKSAELDRIDSTIDALNKKRDAEEEYWDNRISALEAQNDATEKQIELEKLQENLALARNKKVMVMGTNGWEVRSDEQAVAQAEQDIADYTRQQQAQTEIDILNKLKETALANYDSQIQAQEDFKAKQEANYDAQIAVLEGYKTEYNNMINAYEEDQNRLMALQVLGTDFEAQTWQTRLSNLQNYVNRYNTLQASLSNSSSGGEDTVKTSSSSSKAQVVAKVTGVKSLGSKTSAYASGVSRVQNDEIAMIGDDPNNRELVIGGKLNGTATKLTSGSGVVNADAMKTWAGIMNNIGNSNLMSKAMGGNITNSNSTAQSSIVIQNVSLPSVTNARSFIDELNNMSFSRNMLQQAFSTT